ncbi:diacylglycerol kinase [Rhizobium sp. FY34]|uniref:diacylglycerol kinase n=1 Tax=Rhizobium sp. FY34 TaxID=2562309 RepID=UPI0010C0BF16|nr:diacylglycerol kinase [Rhizobium sp. FY34]
MTEDKNVPIKVHGWRHLLAAQTYSIAGFRRLLQETAFRHEILAYLVFLLLFFAVGAHPGEYIALTVIFLVLCAVEALNTAIEEIIDRISPELSVTGRHAKDLGSFAVFCLLLAGAALVGYVLFSRLSPLWT